MTTASELEGELLQAATDRKGYEEALRVKYGRAYR